jgi:hypothetical protein
MTREGRMPAPARRSPDLGVATDDVTFIVEVYEPFYSIATVEPDAVSP